MKKEAGQTVSLSVAPDLKDASDSCDRVDDLDEMQAVYGAVAKTKNVTCNCIQSNWDVEPEEIEDNHDFRLTFRCKKCQVTKETVLSSKDLKDIQLHLEIGMDNAER